MNIENKIEKYLNEAKMSKNPVDIAANVRRLFPNANTMKESELRKVKRPKKYNPEDTDDKSPWTQYSYIKNNYVNQWSINGKYKDAVIVFTTNINKFEHKSEDGTEIILPHMLNDVFPRYKHSPSHKYTSEAYTDSVWPGGLFKTYLIIPD